MCGVGIVSLLLLTSLDAADLQVTQIAALQPDKTVRTPRDARTLTNRTDLADLFKQRPEIRIIVGLQTPDETAQVVAGTDDQTRQQAVSARQTSELDRIRGLNVRDIKRFRFHPFVAMTVDATALGQLLADPDVTSISEDAVLFPLLVDTVSLTRVNTAWAEGFRGVGQTIAVIDSGLDATHPFFAGKVVAEACFSNPGAGSTTLCPNGQPQQIGTGAGINCPDYNLGCWHGTHIAGIAAGNYGYLTANTGGIGYGASVMAIQVFQKDCSSGTCQLAAYYSDIMQSLEHVYSMRNSYAIAAANLSLGGTNFSATCDYEAPGVTSVVQSLRAANIATVVAAGNAAMPDAISFPACISEAISVGSTTKQNAISAFSNSASFLSLLAPGSTIQSSLPGGGYGYTSGTSVAAPHVTGAWATLKSAKPTATVSEVLAALTTGGLPITDPRNGISKSLVQVGDTETQLGALGVLLGRPTPSGAPVVSISPTDLLAKEAGLDPAAFTVTRTGNTSAALTVQYGVSGKATPGADYLALSGTITIPAGATTAVITVTPLDDALVESNETVIVNLLSMPGYNVGTSSAATVKIASDDAPGAPTLQAPQGRLSKSTRP
jgi:hypothetical protein